MSKTHSIIANYLNEVRETLSTGDAREHAYRSALKKLIEELNDEILVINEPAYKGGNAPDFLFKKGETPIAYAECKDVSIDISNKDVQKQANRYVVAFGRILLTNYYDFEIITEESEETQKISIATCDGKTIFQLSENFEVFVNLLKDYLVPSYRTIRSAKKLAEIMASKARILRDNALVSLDINKDSDISAQYTAFKEILIHELTPEEFVDMYAQTLVYGLFVARYHDSSLDNFSRYEAQDLLPSTNPLLKKFFGHVAGTEYDTKIAWLVDSLVEAYASTDVAKIMHKEFVKKQKDPVLHFYETFLSKYNQDLRKSRGVYYTPTPVVSFIVRSVDEILKTKFNLAKGLADTTKISHTEKIQATDARTKDGIKKEKIQIHKVQILDPAVGTGTFLNEVIEHIHKSFVGQEGLWSGYIHEHLVPRLHGFELMMASYTMAHLKLGVTLKELGYKNNERLSVWLTNSLEEGIHEVPNLFMSQWLTEESNEASKIKSEMPIMVVLGNPPYAVSSSNKGEKIQELIEVYKKDLNERNIQPLSDDYIKFIRFAENQIEKTGEGVVAMITNNSFIDGVIHRQMRKHLMETFDEIYVLDLHGNSKKKEAAPDGSKDENVFDIMQGVSVNIFVKNRNDKKLADVYHSEIFGKRAKKFEKLNSSEFGKVDWQKLENKAPYYFFVPKDFAAEDEYKKGFGVDDVLTVTAGGIKTHRDHLVVDQNKSELEKRIQTFFDKSKSNKEIRNELRLRDNRDWTMENARNNSYSQEKIKQIQYRPFDLQSIYYDKKLIDFGREQIMKHMIAEKNYGLCLMRNLINTKELKTVFISSDIIDLNFYGFQTYLFPLYLYHEDGTKTSNLKKEIWDKINEVAGETKPENILDYIYAVLHSPNYRKKYKEFLKIDFPRVPYPNDKQTFEKLVELGEKLRKLHLLESSEVEKFITTFPEDGTSEVEKGYPRYENGNVQINEKQYFGNVSEVAWNFYIGGYQPAQKWLKDRKERKLSTDEILHYQKMIVSLIRTDELMREIDKTFKF